MTHPNRRLVATVGAFLVGCCAFVVLCPPSSSAFQRGRKSSKSKEQTPKSTKKREAKALPTEKKPPTKDDAADSADERKKLSDLREAEPLPRLKELSVPTVDQLHQHPVDWLVLKGPNKGNEFVIVAKQVFPRPDTLKKLEAALAELKKQPSPSNEQEREKYAAQRNELSKLVITLPDDAEGQPYEVPTASIDHIVYHEDLTIRRAGLLTGESRFRDAFELLFALERQAAGWPGLKDESQRLLFIEADAAAKRHDLESALTSLEELRSRNRDYSGLQARLGEVADQLIGSAHRAGDDRRTRHFLARLARIEPKHEVVGKWNSALLAEAQSLMAAAIAGGRRGRHDAAVTTIDRAARVWPQTPGLAEVHRQLSDRFQRLAVGVLSLPERSGKLPFETLADRRATRLCRIDVFEVDRVDDATHYRSRLLEQWEPADLGRRAVLTLKSTPSLWEAWRPLTGSAVVSTLAALLDSTGPEYDERLAASIESVHLLSPYDVEIRFVHAPPRIEPLFRFPITAANGGSAKADSWGPSHAAGPRILSRRFETSRSTEHELAFRRVTPQPDGLDQYQVAEVVEREYDSPQHAIQALARGDVSMIPDLPTWAVATLRDDPRYFVLDYAVPTTHVLQLNPHSEALKSRELRLAMAYAIEAPRLLDRVVLRDSNSQSGRTITAPFASTSYAYNRLVPPRDFSLNMAASLREAATKRLKQLPKLRMICDPGVSARSAAAAIVKEWAQAGIPAEILPPGADVPGWDVAYRTLRMEEPLAELWPFLTTESRARLESLRHLPDWLRLELLALENSPDWKTAVGRLQELHRHLYAEVEYIPLWEVDDALVLRKNVHDFPPYKFVHPYQNVERWIIQSWYPEGTP